MMTQQEPATGGPRLLWLRLLVLCCGIVFFPEAQSQSSTGGHNPNLYRILGVPRSASLAEIKRAFRQRSLELHPDKAPGAPETFFRGLKEAYDILRDPQRRSLYDRGVKTGRVGGFRRGGSATSSSSPAGGGGTTSRAGTVRASSTTHKIGKLEQLLGLVEQNREKFVLVHVYHGQSRLASVDENGDDHNDPASDWVLELTETSFFEVAHVSVFQAETALLEYLNIDRHPRLVLFKENLRSEPFDITDNAFEFGLVAEHVKYQALRLLKQNAYSSVVNLGLLNFGSIVASTSWSTAGGADDQHRSSNSREPEASSSSTNSQSQQYHAGGQQEVVHLTTYELLNFDKVHFPNGSGCLRVLYLAQSEDENFEFYMLAQNRNVKYPFACFFHVMPGAVAADAFPGIAKDLSGEDRGQHASSVDHVYEQTNAPYVIVDPFTEQGVEVQDFARLQAELDKRPHEKQMWLREATERAVSNGKFLVLFLVTGGRMAGEGSTGGGGGPGKRNLVAYQNVLDFCEQIGKEGATVACFWSRAHFGAADAGAAATTGGPGGSDAGSWPEWLAERAAALVGDEASSGGSDDLISGCPVLALFDGPTRFVGLFEDDHQPAGRRFCLDAAPSEREGSLEKALRYWWLRHRGRKAVRDLAVPAFGRTKPATELGNGPLPFVERFYQHVAQLVHYVRHDFVETQIGRRVNFVLAEFARLLQRFLNTVADNYEALCAALFILTCTTLVFLTQWLLHGTWGGGATAGGGSQHREAGGWRVDFCFAVELERDEVTKPWGMQMVTDSLSGNCLRLVRIAAGGCLDLEYKKHDVLVDDKRILNGEARPAPISSSLAPPFRPQIGDYIRSANGETVPARIFDVFKQERKLRIVVHRPQVSCEETDRRNGGHNLNPAVLVDRVDFLPADQLQEIVGRCTEVLVAVAGRAGAVSSRSAAPTSSTAPPPERGPQSQVVPQMITGERYLTCDVPPFFRKGDAVTGCKSMDAAVVKAQNNMMQVNYTRLVGVGDKCQVGLRIGPLVRDSLQTTWGIDIMGSTRTIRRVSRFAAAFGFEVGDKICVVKTTNNQPGQTRGQEEDSISQHSCWAQVLHSFKQRLQIDEVVVLRWVNPNTYVLGEKVRAVEPEEAEQVLLRQYGARRFGEPSSVPRRVRADAGGRGDATAGGGQRDGTTSSMKTAALELVPAPQKEQPTEDVVEHICKSTPVVPSKASAAVPDNLVLDQETQRKSTQPPPPAPLKEANARHSENGGSNGGSADRAPAPASVPEDSKGHRTTARATASDVEGEVQLRPSEEEWANTAASKKPASSRIEGKENVSARPPASSSGGGTLLEVGIPAGSWLYERLRACQGNFFGKVDIVGEQQPCNVLRYRHRERKAEFPFRDAVGEDERDLVFHEEKRRILTAIGGGLKIVFENT